MSTWKLLLTTALVTSLAVSLISLSVYLKLVEVQKVLAETRERLDAMKSEIGRVHRTLSDSNLLVNAEVLVTCGNLSTECNGVYTYAGAPAILAIANCTSVEVASNGSDFRVVSALGVRSNWALKVCREGSCATSSLMQSLWGGEKVVLACVTGQP